MPQLKRGWMDWHSQSQQKKTKKLKNTFHGKSEHISSDDWLDKRSVINEQWSGPPYSKVLLSVSSWFSGHSSITSLGLPTF